jgi:ribose 5-phosphate isomerase A
MGAGRLSDISQDELKRQAAHAAAALVEDGMLLGLGSGTTAELFVRAVGERLTGGLRVCGVASSSRTERVARAVGLPLVALNTTLDLTVDGADVIERESLTAIKGRGGALTREKLVALAARRFVLVGDESKVVSHLTDAQPGALVPVEVLQFGCELTRQGLAHLGDPRLRMRDGMPFVTDNGNYIIDLYEADLSDAARLAHEIRAVPGVVEHGLFLSMASVALIAGASGVRKLRRGTRSG